MTEVPEVETEVETETDAETETETETDFVSLLGPALAGALEKKGFTALTPVQQTVLDPALAGRDLRITSQTGSGKTVAVGFALRALVTDAAAPDRGIARPRAIVVAPTRELAKQVEEELSWLYAPLRVRVASATGGANLRDERRALAMAPAVIVGTPGRLLDHLDRGAIDPADCAAVVLDEADRLLDMGFREELERILAHVPQSHATHLVSATFPREVRSLADAVQNDPVHVEGTRLGQANADIDHVLHLVDGRDRFGAIVNLLLANPDEQMLIFARTRADVGDIADALVSHGFSAASLSGEMEQPARDRALAAFKRGDLRALVATDVAARGIDVQDIARVLHADPPGDADTYTHRSGRTGRAGRKGTSSVLVPPSVMAKVVRLLQRARVSYRFEKLPGADQIRRAGDDHLLTSLTADAPAPGDDDIRAQGLAARLAETGNVQRTIARLLVRAQKATGPEPIHIRAIEPPSLVPRTSRRNTDSPYSDERPRAPRAAWTPRGEGAPGEQGAPADESARPEAAPHSDRGPRPGRAERDASGGWKLFQVSWGEAHGADSRRLLAMLCRRGGIQSSDVGAIRIGRIASTVEIGSDVADQFSESASQVDARDPRIEIRPFTPGAPSRDDRQSGPRDARQSGPRDDRPAFRPARTRDDRPAFRPSGDRPDGDRPSWRPGPPSNRSPQRPDGDRPSWRPGPGSDRPAQRPDGDRPSYRPAPEAPRPRFRPEEERPAPRPAPQAEKPSWKAALETEPEAPARPKRRRVETPAPVRKKPAEKKERASVKSKTGTKKPATAGGDSPPKRRPAT